MRQWYRTNRLGAAGVLTALLFGGIEVLILWFDGVKLADLQTPLGIFSGAVAAQFTESPSLLRAGSARRLLTYQLVVSLQLLSTLVFALLVWRRTRPGAPARAIQMVQMAIGVCDMSALLYVLAAQHAVMLPLRQGLKWLAAQMLLLAGVFIYMSLFHDLQLGDHFIAVIWMYGSLGLLFQALTFGVAWLAVREHRARTGLAAANASLLATQAMLADTVRASERMRIARDLHDVAGHHLTALHLHLDLAARQAGAALPPALQTARELARSLLAEVRGMVSNERQEQRIDLASALATLCAGIPVPSIALRCDPALDIASPALAHTLFFCTQEALTNVLRHSGATRLSIEVTPSAGGVLLAVSDNGSGMRGAAEGNGLRGMRERVAAVGGSLSAGLAGAGGLRLEVRLPAGSA